MISFLNDINKMFYLLIGAGVGMRIGQIAIQMTTGSIDTDTAKKKIIVATKAAILATVINSLAVIIKGYYGG